MTTSAARPAGQANTFIPAHPPPRARFPGLLPAFIAARRDLLSFWWPNAYRSEIMTMKLLGRQIFVANSPDSVRHVMLTNNANYHRKSPQMRRALEFLLGDGLFISDGDLWAERRAAVAPVVHRNRLAQFAPMMVEVTADRAARWAGLNPDAPVDVLTEMASLTAAIIARSVFGWSLDGDMAGRIIRGFASYQSRIDQVNVGYFLGADEGWPTFKGPKLRRASRMVRDSVARIVEEHEAGRGDDRSIVARLMELGRPLSPEAIVNEAVTIFMAGHETTAATLTWTWYLLSQARWAEDRLHDEIDGVLGGRPPGLDDIPRLPYTRAVIEEALRLYPPVPILSRQAVADDVICGEPIEAGGLVMVIPWLLHRHRLYWDRPDHFIPERFLERRPSPFAYLPFATGPRICAGAAFGLTEAMLCLVILAQRFSLRLPQGATVRPRCRLTLRPEGGLPMYIRPRRGPRPA